MIGVATKCSPEPTLLAQAVEAGFSRVELWLDAAFLARWAEVVSLARTYPLQYGLHFPNRLEQSQATLEHAANLYRELDSHSMVIHQPHFDRYGKTLADLEPGMRLGVENHNLTPTEFDDWASSNPGLTLDVEHLWKYTLKDCPLKDLLAAVKRFLGQHREKLHHVHLPGYVPGYVEHRPFYCSREMVLGVFDLLEEAGFERLIVSEVALEFQNPQDLRMDVLLFQRWQIERGK